MPDYFYDMDLVVDPLNPSNVVAKGQVAIYDPADTAGTTLLALKDPSGLPLPNPLTSNANGFLPPRIAEVPQTMWKSGGFTGYFNSYKGLRDEAVSAVASAEAAASNASVAATIRLDELIAAGNFEGPAGPLTNLTVGTVEATPGNPLTDEIIASEVASGTLTTAALSTKILAATTPKLDASVAATTYAGKSLVPVAPIADHLGVYDRRISTYNLKPSNTRILNSAIARGRAGGSLVKLAFCGDSTIKGVGATNVLTNSVVGRLRARMVALGYPLTGTGLSLPYSGTGDPDPRWTISAGWGPFSIMVGQAYQANATATFVSDQPGTVVSIYSLNNATNATWSYRIDGGAEVTVTPSAAQTVQVTNISGLANTTHTVVIKALTSNTTFLVGIEVRAASGLSISRIGLGGATAADWNSTSWWGPRKIMEAYDPDAIVFQLETNDARTGVATPVATYASAMTTITAWMKVLGDLVIMTGYPVQSVDLTPYTDVLYDLADSLDVPLIDVQDRWGAWTVANANGLLPDALHPGDAGYGDAERLVAAVLAL